MLRPLVVGNWKAYVSSLKDAKKLFKSVEKNLPRDMEPRVVLCPPHPFLEPLARSYSGSRIAFGAQDAFFENGAHTGETTMGMVKSVGAEYVILGHAERRAQGETDAMVSKKIGAALDERLTPVVSVGESVRDREGHYLEELEKSITGSLALVDVRSLKKIVIAYEPVWAIGAPLPPTGHIIRQTLIFIRKTLALRFDRADALKARIIYGGAVNEETARSLLEESEADGLLLGRASVDPDAFAAIIHSWEK